MSAQDTNTLENPLDFPLFGSRLIEASAGTGKTYTIAALFVRLVLQHGTDETRFGKELMPKDILVMTFTNAATAELADRIRARLSEAAAFFRSEESTTKDKFLTDLKADCVQQNQNLTALARRLELAAQSMDESSVYTINGWCQKMLTEHAFASGSLFQQTVQTEEDELRIQAAEDYFRAHIYTIENVDAAAEVLSVLKSPASLVKYFKAFEIPDEAALNAERDELIEAMANIPNIRAKYADIADGLVRLIPSFPEKGFSYETGIINKLYLWTLGRFDGHNLGARSRVELLLPEKFVKKLSTMKPAPAIPQEIGVLAELADDLAALQTAAAQFSRVLEGHARYYIGKRLEQLKAQAAVMGFDDMLTRLRDALRGPNGDALAATIRKQYPVALVDEFQDTDPVQYEIFDRVYAIEENVPETGIFLIGDPKQAIYSFRDADIFTYLKARKATVGRHYNLQTNYRSSHAMVEAINDLFAKTEANAERGAFLYKDEIPFVGVKANGQKREFRGLDGNPAPALEWAVIEEKAENKSEFQSAAAHYHANYIAKLLNSDSAGFYEGHERTPVRSQDIAILVGNATEARVIRKELTARGIRSVYLSERDSVYSQPIAQDLLAVVQACAQPRNPSRVRSALATPLLAYPLSELVAFQENEQKWEEAVEKFIGYHQIWERRGILATLHQLLHDMDIPKRLLADKKEGERQLADALHICELLQQESRLHEGMAGLEEYFALQVQEYKSTVGQFGNNTRKTNSESLQLRLESDSELVKVITYHKSKGLQYPLVFMPFAAYTWSSIKPPKSYHQVDENGNRVKMVCWDTKDADAKALIEEEALAEALRKMYVALTRAEFATFVTMQPVGHMKHNPLFYLLQGEQKEPDNLLQTARTAWQTDHTAVVKLQLEALVEVNEVEESQQILQARKLPESFKLEQWWVASYSALKYGSELHAPETPPDMNILEEIEVERSEAFDESEDAQAAETKKDGVSPQENRIHHLPKGAGPGTFLHALLEDAAELGFAEVAQSPALLNELLDKRCRSKFWQTYREELESWLPHYLQTSFPLAENMQTQSAEFSLAGLQSYKAEPEFWFGANQVQAQHIDALMVEHILPGHARPKLERATLNGMLKGFIDLVFEFEGRYYVADYKSNWLGAIDEDYSFENMRKKILASRYDLQYVIYTLALHRLLKARLGDAYDYETHIGGAVYLFLRGNGANTAGAFCDRPPQALIEALDVLFAEQHQAEGAADAN